MNREPRMQNIPIRTAEGSRIRRLFRPEVEPLNLDYASMERNILERVMTSPTKVLQVVCTSDHQPAVECFCRDREGFVRFLENEPQLGKKDRMAFQMAFDRVMGGDGELSRASVCPAGLVYRVHVIEHEVW